MPRRHRESDLEAWVGFASRLPWWAGAMLAGISYFGLHAIAQMQVETPNLLTGMSGVVTGSMIRVIAGIGQYLVPLVFLVGAALSVFTAHRKQRLLAEAKLS
jgi:restriction system protein